MKTIRKMGLTCFKQMTEMLVTTQCFYAFDLGNIGGCYAFLMMFIEGGDVSKVGFYST